jgi:hypothetical protein
MAYGDNNTGGAFAGVNTEAFTKFVESNYKWTDPPRWFKANDPYWYQLDNLPIKQIHENCKWLKDQVEFTLQASGVGRSDFNELRPYAVGSDRKVRVLPGNFIGRVNDAYNKGIATYEVAESEKYLSFLSNILTWTVDVVYEQYNITLRDKVFATLIGYNIDASSSFPSNGLFDSLQHHQTMNYYGEDLPEPYTNKVYARKSGPAGNTHTTSILGGMENLPKIKLALWQGTATNYLNPHSALQQRAVDFTRRWGGVTRTAVVNSGEIITVDVPEFSDSDFALAANYVPQVRIDLIFMYTHPVDTRQTTILEMDGDAPTSLTETKLGIVKGAGVVTVKNQGSYPDTEADIQGSPVLVDGEEWLAIRDTKDLWYNAQGQAEYDLDEGVFQMRGIVADQRQSLAGFKDRGIFGSFPSPDDLMNLAPYLQADLEDNEYALLGQSILPLAYIVVKKGASLITQEDVIDIRPFFRTAELAYNERSGIAAAHPPLSLANPAVGRKELQEVLDTYSNAVGQLVYDLSSGLGVGGGPGSFVDPDTSSTNSAFAYGTVLYGPGEWDFTHKRSQGGGGAGMNTRIRQQLPPSSGAVFASLKADVLQLGTSHSSNDGDQIFAMKLLFYNNEDVLVKEVNSENIVLGRNRNNNHYYREAHGVIPLDADRVEVKFTFLQSGSGDNESQDSVNGSVSAFLTVTYGVTSTATVVTP